MQKNHRVMNAYDLIYAVRNAQYSHGESNVHVVSKAEAPAFHKIWNLMEQLTPLKDEQDCVREFWLFCPRDDPEHPFEKEKYFCHLPEQTYWFRFGTVQTKTHKQFTMNHQVFTETTVPEWNVYKDSEGLPELLEWLVSAVEERIEQMKSGSYASILEQELSYRKRFGIVDKRKLWELYPELREKTRKRLTAEERAAFCRTYKEDTAHPPKLLPCMTPRKYFEYCLACFKTLGLKKAEQESEKEWIHRICNSRAEWILLEMDEDDADGFEEWSRNPIYAGHRWEFLFGSYCFKVVYQDGGCLFRVVSSCWLDGETILCFLAFRERGVPVSLAEFKQDYDALQERGHVAIAPYDHPYLRYNHCEKYDEVTWLEKIPYDERFAKLIAITAWQPILPWSNLDTGNGSE